MKRLHTLEQTLVSYEKQYEDLAVKLDRSYKHTNQQVALVKKGERAQHVHLLQTLTNLWTTNSWKQARNRGHCDPRTTWENRL